LEIVKAENIFDGDKKAKKFNDHVLDK